MKGKIITLAIVLGISMFLGIVLISIGLGSAFPSLNKVAASSICGSEHLEITQNTYSYRPGQGTITITAYCVADQTGARREVTTALQLLSGVMYGFIIFVLAMIGVGCIARRLKARGM